MNIEELLTSAINEVADSTVKEAMKYSLLAGGKRIRPNLLFDVLKGYGLPEERGSYYAAALEMIHTYSLIHDDLPAMDNDDLRRGLPTCHKQFDEATAILAGDGLLTYAFQYASKDRKDPEKTVKCMQVLSRMAGPDGMVLGQCLDIEEGETSLEIEDIRRIQNYKTGCLLSAPLMMAAILADQNDEIVEQWHEVGEKIGFAFQIQDDILDQISTPEILGKTNSDDRNEKVTTVSLLGMEKAAALMNALYDDSCKQIRNFGGFESDLLLERVKAIRNRNM